MHSCEKEAGRGGEENHSAGSEFPGPQSASSKDTHSLGPGEGNGFDDSGEP